MAIIILLLGDLPGRFGNFDHFSPETTVAGDGDDGIQLAQRVLALAQSPSGFLATVQVGITLAGFFAAAVGAVSLSKLIRGWLEAVPVSWISDHASAIALVGDHSAFVCQHRVW